MSFKIQKSENIMSLQNTPVQMIKTHGRSMRPSVFLNDIDFIGDQQPQNKQITTNDAIQKQHEDLHLPQIQAPKMHRKNKISMPEIGVASPISKQVSPTYSETFENIFYRQGSITERVPIFQRNNSKAKLFKKLEPLKKHVEFNENVTEIDIDQGVKRISTLHEGFTPLIRTHFHLKHFAKD